MMIPHPLRVGAPALPGGPRTSVEGGRVAFDGTDMRILVVFDRPTSREVRAVRSGPVDLGVYHRDGLAAVAVVAGEPLAPSQIEACAPLVFDRYETGTHPVLHGHGTGAEGTRAHLVLCDARDMIVRAFRTLAVPHALVQAIHQAAHAQAWHFEDAREAGRVHEVGLRSLTAGYLLRHAAARARVAGCWLVLVLCA